MEIAPMTDEEIEREIREKGLTAPRVTPESIEARIVEERYFSGADGLEGSFEGMHTLTNGMSDAFRHVTFCAMMLDNGSKIVGINYGSVDPKNFDSQLGKKLARQKAIDQIWELEGYLMRERLFRQDRTFADAEARALADLDKPLTPLPPMTGDAD